MSFLWVSAMKMEDYTMSRTFVVLGWSAVVLMVVYWVYRVADWVWLRPKKLEKILRDQGLRGNSYRLLLGDQYESGKLIRQALSKPISMNDDMRERVIPHILKTIRTYGSNSFMWVGRIPRVNITDPELVKDVFTKYEIFEKNYHSLDPITGLLFTGLGRLEGEPWAKRRRTLNPAFLLEKLKLLVPALYTSARNVVSKWEKIVPDGRSVEVDVQRDIKILTADVISRTFFGSNYEEGQRIFELLDQLIALTIETTQSVDIPGRWLLPTKRNKAMREIDKQIKIQVMGVIEKKVKALKEEEDSNNIDFLGLMLKCSQDEIAQQNGDGGLSIEDIVNECKLFHFAGQDTSTSLMSWTMILLSRYPIWQERAREEVLQVFGDRKPDYEGLSRLKIITMILHEVLRCYPPVVEITKVAKEDTKLGNLLIPAGVKVMMPQLLLHYDPANWGEDAMEFNPERFAQGVLNATKSQGSFFPFILGPRTCIGQNFALLEAKMSMSLILKSFSFQISPSYVHAPFTVLNLHPQHGIHLILRRLN